MRKDFSMIPSLELEIARHQLRRFVDAGPDRALVEHHDAMECRDCEEFLQKGIDAYKWLSRAEEAFLQADADGVIELTDEIEQSVKKLYEGWQQPCTFAEKWIATLTQRDYCIDNLPEFRHCCSLVRDWLDRDAWHRSAKRARDERLAEEPW
jgi:hypothetical protein